MNVKINHSRIKAKKESTFGKTKKPFKGSGKNRKGNKKESYSQEFQKILDKRIKPKYSAKNKKKLTTEDAKYLEYLQGLNVVCFCCGQQRGIEWHHVKLYSSDVKNHTRLIPLCGVECHRLGKVLSAHGTPKKWRETFSMEQQNEVADSYYQNYLLEMA